MKAIPDPVINSSEPDSSLGHMPDGRWAFDANVTQVFDDMLRRSIPQYDVMRQAVYDVGCKFIKRDTDIVDLGCARGEALAPFVDRFGAQNRYLGVEVSEPMLAATRQRYAGLINTGVMRVQNSDLRYTYPLAKASLTLSIFTVQFVPIEYRPRLLADVFASTVPGGAIVLAEKIIGSTGANDRLFVDLYYDMKRRNGYSQDEIDRKRFSLEGVLVPVTAKWNEDLLREAGFSRVENFWRWMNFGAWLGVKPA
ncbi:MAG TPA: methyltransferase domain-containing protein [bacterium]|nr:methyltransferase domain-containing protein [bacterium]